MARKSYSRRNTRKYKGGRGGMGGAELGHAYTTSASQELYQMTGKTPGLSSGGARGAKSTMRRRETRRVERNIKKLEHKANMLEREANKLELEANKLENQANILHNKVNMIKNRNFKMNATAPEWNPPNVQLDKNMSRMEEYIKRRILNEENHN